VSQLNLIEGVKKFFKLSQVCGSNLLESPRTKIAHIEFTSRCNLRCVFCFASQPGYKGVDIDAEIIERTIESLKSRNVDAVAVSGHGETTIYKEWHRYCDKMLDAGMPLHIISNFAKELSDEELKTLSRFKSIEISCDTDDPALFKKMRRGANLKILCLNILRLRAMAIKEDRQSPTISFSCVVSDQNIFHMMDYVSFGKALGVTHFNFCNLTKYPDLKDTLNPKHITEIPVELLHKAEKSLAETFEFLQRSKIKYHFQQGLLDSLSQKIQASSINKNTLPTQDDSKNNPVKENKDDHTGENDMREESQKVEALDSADDMAKPHRYSSTRQEAQTRDCLDPWQFIMIQANTDVLPCCWHQPICSLGKGQSLADVFNNTWIKELRKSLLTSNISDDCMNCPSRGWTSIKNLQKKVWHYLNPGINKLLFPKIPGIKPDILKDFQVVYEYGWYEPESDSYIKDPGWQNWRWTSQKALCKLENPKREALLILRGSVNKSIHENQTICIKINDTVLDEFTPGTAKFFKEYVITPEMMGENNKVTLIIETDKIFVPFELNPGIKDNRELGIQIYHLFFGEKFK
jgi:MoaA/NifB/PqqE/SkfB family radical SAM enzyme